MRLLAKDANSPTCPELQPARNAERLSAAPKGKQTNVRNHLPLLTPVYRLNVFKIAGSLRNLLSRQVNS